MALAAALESLRVNWFGALGSVAQCRAGFVERYGGVLQIHRQIY